MAPREEVLGHVARSRRHWNDVTWHTAPTPKPPRHLSASFPGVSCRTLVPVCTAVGYWQKDQNTTLTLAETGTSPARA